MVEVWSAVAAVVGAMLIFITTAWRLYQDHLPLRKLERIVEVRSRITEGTDAAKILDEAITVLAKRSRTASYPVGRERMWAVGGGLSTYVVGMILFFTAMKGADDNPFATNWPILVIAIMGFLMSVVGSFAPSREKVV